MSRFLLGERKSEKELEDWKVTYEKFLDKRWMFFLEVVARCDLTLVPKFIDGDISVSDVSKYIDDKKFIQAALEVQASHERSQNGGLS